MYPPQSVAKYSFIQLSELEQCRVNKLAQGFNTAAQDLNPSSRSRESEALPLSHCTLQSLEDIPAWSKLLPMNGTGILPAHCIGK